MVLSALFGFLDEDDEDEGAGGLDFEDGFGFEAAAHEGGVIFSCRVGT